jgi:putative intracellular protease/amidase
MVKILIVSTSSDAMPLKDGSGNHTTGAWLEEIAAPYFVFTGAGHEVVIASPNGGKIPVDQGSLQGDFYTAECKKFMDDAGCAKLLNDSVPLASLKHDDFAAVYFAGGHGTYGDFMGASVKSTVEAFWEAGKVVAADCHGPVALCGPESGGAPIVKGCKLCAFSDSEETAVGLAEKVPFMLESRLKELGATIDCGPDWGPKAVTHKSDKGTLVTGQNPASSTACAKAVVAALG